MSKVQGATCRDCGKDVERKPCPYCGSSDSLIIGTVNESVSIQESSVAVKKNRFTKIGYFGFIVLLMSVGLQWYFSYANGGIISLIISSLMALLLFIPSYYVFLRIYFTDTESLVNS